MKANRSVTHEFVEFMPKERQEGVIYVSMEYATAVHSCFCGCGLKVVTPLSPTDWTLTFDGETISLSPSIGNWGFPCRSHYWLKRDTVVWAGDMSADQIQAGRDRSQVLKDLHLRRHAPPPPPPPPPPQLEVARLPKIEVPAKKKWSLIDWLLGRNK